MEGYNKVRADFPSVVLRWEKRIVVNELALGPNWYNSMGYDGVATGRVLKLPKRRVLSNSTPSLNPYAPLPSLPDPIDPLQQGKEWAM